MEVHEDGGLDARLMDLLHKVEGLFELLLDFQSYGVAKGRLFEEIKVLGFNLSF